MYLFVPSSSGPSPHSPHHLPEVVDVEELIARIQEHVSTNRIRVSEHFQDFDPLRSGSISAARFRQVLVSLKPRLSFWILSGSFGFLRCNTKSGTESLDSRLSMLLAPIIIVMHCIYCTVITQNDTIELDIPFMDFWWGHPVNLQT